MQQRIELVVNSRSTFLLLDDEQQMSDLFQILGIENVTDIYVKSKQKHIQAHNKLVDFNIVNNDIIEITCLDK